MLVCFTSYDALCRTCQLAVGAAAFDGVGRRNRRGKLGLPVERKDEQHGRVIDLGIVGTDDRLGAALPAMKATYCSPSVS